MAGTSQRLGTPYPTASDPANVANDMQAIATATNLDKAVVYNQGTTQPSASSSIPGQLWWCTNASSVQYGLNYWDGTSWNAVPDCIVASSTPTAASGAALTLGKLWFNTSTQVLNYYNGSTWVAMSYSYSQIAPSATNNQVLSTLGGATVWATPTNLSVPYFRSSTNHTSFGLTTGSPAIIDTVLSTNYGFSRADSNNSVLVSVAGVYRIFGYINGSSTSQNYQFFLKSGTVAGTYGTTVDSGDIIYSSAVTLMRSWFDEVVSISSPTYFAPYINSNPGGTSSGTANYTGKFSIEFISAV